MYPIQDNSDSENGAETDGPVCVPAPEGDDDPTDPIDRLAARLGIDDPLALSHDEWAALLAKTDPDDYLDKPLSPAPGLALDRAARVELMRKRALAGKSVFHARADMKPETGQSGDLGRDVTRGRNGVITPKQLRNQHEPKKESEHGANE